MHKAVPGMLVFLGNSNLYMCCVQLNKSHYNKPEPAVVRVEHDPKGAPSLLCRLWQHLLARYRKYCCFARGGVCGVCRTFSGVQTARRVVLSVKCVFQSRVSFRSPVSSYSQRRPAPRKGMGTTDISPRALALSKTLNSLVRQCKIYPNLSDTYHGNPRCEQYRTDYTLNSG